VSEQAAAKVTGAHLARTAYLYVRQSTLRQVLTNTESAARQYGLRQKAIALGWAAEAIVTIDTDQGQSGASAADREGFQRLVAEVGMGRAGIVLGLEVSRLARNNADWHRLLEICAMSGTLICDEDGLYDPTDFNDRLLLGLKGTMSEAELHFIRVRRHGRQFHRRRHHGGVRRANRLEDHAFRACLAALGVQEEAKRLAVDIQERDGVDLRMRVGLNSGQADAAGGPAVLACWGGPEMAVREAQDEAPIARTLPSHTRSDSASSVSSMSVAGSRRCL
jgi:DNA invertase Pin-like site-specific DNA recombinase